MNLLDLPGTDYSLFQPIPLLHCHITSDSLWHSLGICVVLQLILQCTPPFAEIVPCQLPMPWSLAVKVTLVNSASNPLNSCLPLGVSAHSKAVLNTLCMESISHPLILSSFTVLATFWINCILSKICLAINIHLHQIKVLAQNFTQFTYIPVSLKAFCACTPWQVLSSYKWTIQQHILTNFVWELVCTWRFVP